MKTRRLLIACTLGFFGAGSALAGYGEGTMGADLVALQQQASIPGATSGAAYGPGEGSSETMYEALLAERRVLASEPASGVAGRAGFVLDPVGFDNPEESIYERIVREYH